MNKHIKNIDTAGRFFVELFHRIGLFGIGAMTVWAAGTTFWHTFQNNHATVQDLLLLFIYLEIGAMVGIYFKTHHMPVRFLIYIAITALTRHIVDLITVEGNHVNDIAILGGTTLVLSVSVFIIRYASFNFPGQTDESEEHSEHE